MARRTSPQRTTHDLAFPIRVKVRVLPDGLGRELDRIGTQLKANVTPGGCASHPARGLGGDAVGYHFGALRMRRRS